MAREGHENEQSLHAIPAREHDHCGEHDEGVFPVEAVGVEAVGELHGEDQNDQVKNNDHISRNTRF